MTDDTTKALLKDALRIFLKLRENPYDPEAIQEKEAFLAKGDAEKSAYETAQKAWSAGRQKTPRHPIVLLAALGAGALASYSFYDDIRLIVLADARTGYAAEEVTLRSGDVAVLDAQTAIKDETEGSERTVTLLAGAGFFDVDTRDVPFVVRVDDVTVRALGTAFEVSRLGQDILVSVVEGSVEVSAFGVRHQIGIGEQVIWSQDMPVRPRPVQVSDVAAWRSERLSADGMTLAQVAEVLDRRLAGDVIVFSDALKALQIAGGIDLQNPSAALQALALSVDAQVISVPGVVSILRPS